VPATKFLLVQTLVVFAIVLGGVWFATQWVAMQLGFQPRLGSAWFHGASPADVLPLASLSMVVCV